MACFRSLCNRSSLIRRRVNPSFSYVLHDHDREEGSIDGRQSQKGSGNVLQKRFFGNSLSKSTAFGFCQDRRRAGILLPSGIGMSSIRYMSTTIGESSDKIELMSDVAGTLTEMPMEAVATKVAAINEVAVAAADSFLPVAFLQHCMDAIHSFTGCNWFISIGIATLLIRTATVPLLINQLKATTKLSLLRPRLEKIQQDIRDKGMEPESIYAGQMEMKKLFAEYGVTPFTPLKGIFIQGPVFICFFLAISNMVEKVPSFKNGGAFWFTDLTTPDSMYLLPVLTGLSILITVESNMQEGLEGNPIAGTMKTISRVFAVAAVPLTASFPTALFGYWLTSNMFSLLYGIVLKVPGVKKSLGIPDIPVTPATPSTGQASFNLFPAFKPNPVVVEEVSSSPADVQNEESADVPNEESSVKKSNRRASSSSILSQRIRSLEKQVKDRKKSKK
ncbi:Mitochondrial inner membrane protein OXA1 [Linum grandiflorum]